MPASWIPCRNGWTATIDASFISLRLLLPVVKVWLAAPGEAGKTAGQVIALVKPQFEAGRELVSRGAGVIREAQDHRRILVEVLGFIESAGFSVSGLIRSPLLGPKGNVEFLAWLTVGQEAVDRL
jgi:23S rRNA (cytidine1920-2'-O)/16S rRNA (cytidine1409-2'-O)-methyltransferase